MKKIKEFIKKRLGITRLQQTIVEQNLLIKILKSKVEQLRTRVSNVDEDNRLILHHLEFLNSQFLASADIGDPRRQPNVIIVLQKRGQNIVRTYELRETDLQHIYRILEGFGRNNVIIDKPFGCPNPKFRY